MKTSEVFLQMIDLIEVDINQNSNQIRTILNKIKRLQSAYELNLDHINEYRLNDDVRDLSTDISEIIHAQTDLIEMYASLSAYVLTLNVHPFGITQTERILLDKSLKYCIQTENYSMCSRIRDVAGELGKNLLAGNASI